MNLQSRDGQDLQPLSETCVATVATCVSEELAQWKMKVLPAPKDHTPAGSEGRGARSGSH
jgi:hypothetical protein